MKEYDEESDPYADLECSTDKTNLKQIAAGWLENLRKRYRHWE